MDDTERKVVEASPEQYILVFHPTEHKDAMPTPDVVRAITTRVFRFTSIGRNVTTVELVFTVDLKGSIPEYRWILRVPSRNILSTTW